MKSFFRTFFPTAVFFGLWFGVYFGWGKGLSVALTYGVISGFLAGALAAFVVRYMQNRVSQSPPVLTDETLLRDGRASRDGTPGWLYLTDRRILFEAYPRDETSPEVSTLFQRFPSDATSYELSIPLLHVEKVISRPVGIDSLHIVIADGRTVQFGTQDAADWVDEISDARQKYLDQPRGEDMKLFP